VNTPQIGLYKASGLNGGTGRKRIKAPAITIASISVVGLTATVTLASTGGAFDPTVGSYPAHGVSFAGSDGSPVAAGTGPYTLTYAGAGVHTVSVTATNAAGSSTATAYQAVGALANWSAGNITGVSDGNPIGTIPDASGNAFDLVQTGGNRAILAATGGPTGGPSITFDAASSNWYPIPVGHVVNAQSFTTIKVVRTRTNGFGVSAQFGPNFAELYDAFTDYDLQFSSSPDGTFDVLGTGGAPHGSDPFGWFVASIRCSASAVKINKSALDANAPAITASFAASASANYAGGQLGQIRTSNYVTADLVEYIVFATALSDAALAASIAAKVAQYGLPRPISTGTKAIVGSGNSICHGSKTTVKDGDYCTIAANSLGRPIFNLAKVGQTTAQMTANDPARIDIYFSSDRVLVAQELVNDYISSGLTGAAAYAGWKAYLQARRAAGWKIIFLNTIAATPNFSAAQQTQAAAGNALLAADFSTASSDSVILLPTGGVTYADAMIDVNSFPSPTFADTLHYDNAMHARAAAKLVIAIGILRF
jgi:hypothetical protein